MIKMDSAVSPVIGVMLMLVVTIIIAAVVSSFAGGLASGQQAAPSMAMDVKVVNTGSWVGSGFYATVTGSSSPIPTKDLKLITSWKTTSRTDGTRIIGGNTTTGQIPNGYTWVGMKTSSFLIVEAPYGVGTGVNGSINQMNPEKYTNMWFGNYSLMSGTNVYAYPYGTQSGMAIGSGTWGASDTSGYGVATAYNYTSGTHYTSTTVDSMEAVMGKGWENLKTGDVVNVNLFHIPSGKSIFNGDVAVAGA